MKQKLMTTNLRLTTFSILMLLAYLFHTGCNASKAPQFIRSTPPVTFLIPAGFQGNLRVVYGEPCGAQPKFENGRQLFEFPANGVLILQKQSDVLDTKEAENILWMPMEAAN